MNRTGITVLLLLAAGCVPTREETLDPLVGQDVDAAIESLGQPAETIALEDGKHLYIWRRVYKYDNGRQARSWPERRQAGWFEDPHRPEDARVCSTGLVVGFDFVIESWDYGCKTVIAERSRSPRPALGSMGPSD